MSLLVTVYCDQQEKVPGPGQGQVRNCAAVASMTNPRTAEKMAMPLGWGRVTKGTEEYHYCPKHSLKWRDVDVVVG